MATPTITPTAAPAGPSAAPASPSTGAATPATPSTTPSTPAPKAPETTSAPPVPDTSKTMEEQLTAKMLKGMGPDADAETEQHPDGEAPEGDEVKAAPVAGDQLPSADGEDESEAAEEPDEEDAEGDEPEFEPIDMEAPEAIGPKDLAARLEQSPEVKAVLDANPELRDQMFANARLADKAKQYGEMFGSPAEARVAVEGSQVYSGLREMMGNVQPGDPRSTQQVISAMLAQATLRDENGEVLKDEAGQPVTDGTVGRFLSNTFTMRLGLIERMAQEKGDDETLAALDTIMERAGLRAPSSASEDEMSESQRAQQARIDQGLKDLDERELQNQKQTVTQYEERVFSRIDGVLDKQIASILDRSTGLTPFARESAERAIRSGLNATLKKSTAFKTELELLERMPVGSMREKQHLALATRYIQDHLPTVARPVLNEAGASVKKAAEQKQQAQAARATASQSEVRGSAGAVKQGAQTGADLTRQVMADLTQKLGVKPSMEQILVEKMTRMSAAAAR